MRREQRPRVVTGVEARVGVEHVVEQVVRDVRQHDPNEGEREPAGGESVLSDREQPSQRAAVSVIGSTPAPVITSQRVIGSTSP